MHAGLNARGFASQLARLTARAVALQAAPGVPVVLAAGTTATTRALRIANLVAVDAKADAGTTAQTHALRIARVPVQVVRGAEKFAAADAATVVLAAATDAAGA